MVNKLVVRPYYGGRDVGGVGLTSPNIEVSLLILNKYTQENH